jgi:hypothetical protein
MATEKIYVTLNQKLSHKILGDYVMKLISNQCEVCSLLGYYAQQIYNSGPNSTDVSGQYTHPIFNG